MSADLLAFLRARLDEDEQAVHRLNLADEDSEPYELKPFNGQPYEGGTHLHIGSARVLAEVNAKRRIIDAHPITTSAINPGYGKTGAGFGCETCHDWDGATEGYGYCQTLKLLALPYVDHPDYREEWQV